MRRGLERMMRVLVVAMFLFTVTEAGKKITGDERFAIYELIVNGYKCNIASETIGKAYLSIGEKVGIRQASKEMKKAFATFEKRHKLLTQSTNDKKMKNLLLFMKMNYDELREIVKEPYSLDNAQIVLDAITSISEGSRFIARHYKKKIGYNDPVNRVGLSPMIESIAKYYIAYQAGIRDDNTVTMMKESVAFCEKNIKIRVNYPNNTVAMNQTIAKVDKLWGIVKQFYLSIEEGGLPFIVFKTTTNLKKGNSKYAKMYKELMKAKIKEGK